MSDQTRAVTSDSIPSRAQGAVEAEVDGDRILLSPTDFSYFGLTGAGAPVWDLIDGERSVAVIVAALETQFDAPEGVIASESLNFIDALHAAGLIELS